jgi:hypothetical protein
MWRDQAKAIAQVVKQLERFSEQTEGLAVPQVRPGEANTGPGFRPGRPGPKRTVPHPKASHRIAAMGNGGGRKSRLEVLDFTMNARNVAKATVEVQEDEEARL